MGTHLLKSKHTISCKNQSFHKQLVARKSTIDGTFICA
jgi:hypothetical protein